MKAPGRRGRLGDFAEVVAGQSPEGRFYNDKVEGTPFYQGKKDFSDKFINLPSTWTTQITKTALAGDILMSVRAPVGPVNFATETCCIGRGLAAIRCTLKIDREFLFYQLLWLQPVISGSEGAVFAAINKSQIENIEVVVPALPEQRRIVALLDEAFEGIAKANANANANVENSRSVFESHTDSLFAHPDASWSSYRLGDLAEFRNGINFTKASRGDRIRIVGVKDFAGNVTVPFEQLAEVVTDGKLSTLDAIQRGDILFVRSNGSLDLIGRSLLVEDVPEPTTHSGFTIRARLTSTSVLPEYLCRVLRSNSTRQRMISGGIGANIKSLSQGVLAALTIPVPSDSTQRRICSELDDIEDATNRLESLNGRKLAALDELKKSLLHRAFAGEL